MSTVGSSQPLAATLDHRQNNKVTFAIRPHLAKASHSIRIQSLTSSSCPTSNPFVSTSPSTDHSGNTNARSSGILINEARLGS
ncbi:hypothetical protein P280DRAFT_465363 [Massarina eburnea CBS 473.64]|uniref:Uncharacterized protein n=1 Tax=Massarina eburnea CBS 473.64 TaxID=1395130 RepID=A0A6A6SEM5_9PLEO|nr:hypothetical protein P280DRAFT_465363 [Massarina eburnea CBS 473.64]